MVIYLLKIYSVPCSVLLNSWTSCSSWSSS